MKTIKLNHIFLVAVPAFFVGTYVGGDWLGFMNNSLCYRYLGCNAGFFGYDALIHFLGGIAEVAALLWLAKKYARFDFLHPSFWKNFLVILALVSLIGVGWEVWEFGYDQLRIRVFHEDLMHPVNRLVQPSNSDTMGDLVFGLLGATLTLLALRYIDPESISGKRKAGDNSMMVGE